MIQHIMLSILNVCASFIQATLFPTTASLQSDNVKTVLSIQIPDQDIDSVELLIHRPQHTGYKSIDNEVGLLLRKKVSENRCSFYITDLNELSHYSIRLLKTKDSVWMNRLSENLIAPGDSVTVELKGKSFSQYRTQFSGKGHMKMRWLSNLDSMNLPIRWQIYNSIPDYNTQNIWMNRAYKEILQTKQICCILLDSLGKLPFSGLEKDLLILETLGHFQESCVRGIRLQSGINKNISRSETDTLIQLLAQQLIVPPITDQTTLGMSNKWVNYTLLLNGLYARYDINTRPDGKTTGVYNLIKRYPIGLLRDKMAMKHFHTSANTAALLLELSDALTILTEESYRSTLEKKKRLLNRGKAYNFSLEDPEGLFINLENLKGKVVFMDFWFPNCSPCAQYYQKTIAPAKAHFKNDTDVTFVSVCIEQVRERWTAAIESGLYTSPEIINLYTGIAGWHHDAVKQFGVTGAPKPFLIDSRGNIYTTDYSALGRFSPDELIQTINNCLTEQ